MGFGERLMTIRKDKKLSQSELAQKVSIHANVLGRYEREDARPFVEMAGKLANALGVSVDYLVGNTEQELDTTTLKRIEEVSKLPHDEQQQIFKVVDALIRDNKTKQAYS